MPTDLEQQLARFAEALDREAPTISFDDMVGRGTVAVDVDLLERRIVGSGLPRQRRFVDRHHAQPRRDRRTRRADRARPRAGRPPAGLAAQSR